MQAEKDSYVRIVKETDDGIYVSGIKTPITTSLYTEEIIVMPGLQFTESDSDCAVAFAVPGDVEGLERYVLGPDITTLESEYSPDHGRKYLNKEGLILFDNVFVPHERVFMCGEHRYAAIYANLFATLHRFAYTACKPALYDIMTGAAMLISEYNGTKGILPDPVYANMGKYMSSELFHDALRILQDMSGSLPVNLPYGELLSDEEYGPRISKLFARKEGISTEDHYRLNELIRVIAASNESGLLQFGSKHGGGNKEAEKVAIFGNSLRRMSECKKMVKRMVKGGD